MLFHGMIWLADLKNQLSGRIVLSVDQLNVFNKRFTNIG